MRPGGKQLRTGISIRRRIDSTAAVFRHLVVGTRAWNLWGSSMRAGCRRRRLHPCSHTGRHSDQVGNLDKV